MARRRFRGTIACAGGANADALKGTKHYLSRESVQRLMQRINQNGNIPMCMEHEKSHSIGRVLAAHLDSQNNLVCEFEIDDPLAHQLIDFDDPRFGWKGLSLSHVAGADHPVEVSLCVGQSGKRPDTRITHEWKDTSTVTNPENHKGEHGPEYGTLINASTLDDCPPSSLSSSSMSGPTPFHPPPNGVAPTSSSVTPSSISSPPNSSSFSSPPNGQWAPMDPRSSSSSSPSSAEDDIPLIDFATATREQLVEQSREILKTNMPERKKTNMMMMIKTLMDQRDERDNQLLQEKQRSDEIARRSEEMTRRSEEMTRKQVDTLKIALQKIAKANQLTNSKDLTNTDMPLAADVQKDLHNLAESGGLNAIAQSPALFGEIVKASSMAEETAQERVRMMQQQREQEQQQQKAEKQMQVYGRDHGTSVRIWEEMNNNNNNRLQHNQAVGQYSLPSSSSSSSASWPYPNLTQQQQQQQPPGQVVNASSMSDANAPPRHRMVSAYRNLGPLALIAEQTFSDPKNQSQFEFEARGNGLKYPPIMLEESNKRQRY